MQVQGISLVLSDPLLFPEAIERYADAIGMISPDAASATGVGYFDGDEPLIAKYHPPVSANLVQLMGKLNSNVALATSLGPGSEEVSGRNIQPFRYRNWLFSMSGTVGRFNSEREVQLAIPTYIRENVRGDTVAEMLFHQVLAFLHRQGLLAGERWEISPLRTALKGAMSLDDVWFEDGEPDCSLMLTDGRILLGAALGRPVYVQKIEGLEPESPDPALLKSTRFHSRARGAIFLDTNSLVSEQWETIGPNTLFQVDTNFEVETFSLD
jgi:hypothetical protein